MNIRRKRVPNAIHGLRVQPSGGRNSNAAESQESRHHYLWTRSVSRARQILVVVFGLLSLAALLPLAPAGAISPCGPDCVDDPPASHNPQGTLDDVSRRPSGLRVAGWAIDPDTADSISVDVYVDGVRSARTTANLFRPDVGAAYPGYGDYHGFDLVVPAALGTHQFCAYGINTGRGSGNSKLGCRSIAVSADPFGDSTVSSRDSQSFTVSGWAIDPDTAESISVSVYLNNVLAGSFQAAGYRPDIGTANPGYGDYHGFSGYVAQPFRTNDEVCIVAVNVGAGTSQTLNCWVWGTIFSGHAP